MGRAYIATERLRSIEWRHTLRNGWNGSVPSRVEMPIMKFLFDDESFSFEALRAAGYASGSGADLGEVLVTCASIPDGDEEAWCRQWGALAGRIRGTGLAALAAGHRVSARDALLRASNYYRTAEFYRRSDPDNDADRRALPGCRGSLSRRPPNCSTCPRAGSRSPTRARHCPATCSAPTTPGPCGQPWSTTGASTPRWRRATSRWRGAHSSAGTTCSRSTAQGRRRPAAFRAWCSARTGKRSSPRSSTTRQPCPRPTSAGWS